MGRTFDGLWLVWPGRRGGLVARGIHVDGVWDGDGRPYPLDALADMAPFARMDVE